MGRSGGGRTRPERTRIARLTATASTAARCGKSQLQTRNQRLREEPLLSSNSLYTSCSAVLYNQSFYSNVSSHDLREDKGTARKVHGGACVTLDQRPQLLCRNVTSCFTITRFTVTLRLQEVICGNGREVSARGQRAKRRRRPSCLTIFFRLSCLTIMKPPMAFSRTYAAMDESGARKAQEQEAADRGDHPAADDKNPWSDKPHTPNHIYLILRCILGGIRLFQQCFTVYQQEVSVFHQCLTMNVRRRPTAGTMPPTMRTPGLTPDP